MSVQVSDALQLGSVNMPLDARTRISVLSKVGDIELPFVGMVFYCTATGRHYKVKSLKSKAIGAITQTDAQIDQYELLPDKSDVDAKADTEHVHAQYALKTEIPDAVDLGPYLKKADAETAYARKDEIPDAVDLGPYLKKADAEAAYARKDEIPNGAKPATISLPVPFDGDNDNVSLYLDIGTDPEFAENTYTRIRMTDHYAKMKIFANETFRTMTEGFCGVPEYGATVSFTLDTEMMPGYVPGTVYYARYTWMDSKGAHDGWHGFIFSGDVADMEPIRTLYENPPKVKAESAADGTLSLDYLEGEIQNYTMVTNVTVNLANVANVPFGEALICNIKRTGGTLSVVNGNTTQTYTENKTYMIVVTNFGTPMIAVTETI